MQRPKLKVRQTLVPIQGAVLAEGFETAFTSKDTYLRSTKASEAQFTGTGFRIWV